MLECDRRRAESLAMDSGLLFERQRVVLFEDDVHSGATIGHYCTIVEIDPYCRREFPHNPDYWLVRIYLPHRLEYREVRAGLLLGTQERDDSPLPPRVFLLEIACTPPAEDNDRLAGQYRIRQRWRDFVFEKRDQPVATYELYELGRLCYYVPAQERLDEAYVQRALEDLFGVSS